MDVCKIAAALYQYTAIDDCSRWKVMGLYPRRSGTSTLSFLDRLLEEMPFPIQRIQTDRDLTVLDEFYRIAFRKKIYRTIDELQADLDAWLVEYNQRRPHQGRWCFGKTPMQTSLTRSLWQRKNSWPLDH